MPPERQAIDARALGYAMRLHEWLTVRAAVESWKASEECQVLGRSGLLIATKVHRALTIWLDHDSNEPPGQADQDGSAKVALIAIDRSHDAWITLVARGEVSQAEAEPFIGDLLWLRAALEHVRPHARRFVRPAFDEPDAVAKLFAELSD